MEFETITGLRYLRSKRKEAFISLTTWISATGIAIGVMALIIVIAVMTGFQNEIRERILGINPHIMVMNMEGEIKAKEDVLNAIKKVDGVRHALPFTSFQAMLQSGRQVLGVAVKGVNGDDIGFMKHLVKEGSISELNKKGHILIGKELAKNLGVFAGDFLTIVIPFGGYSPAGAMPETLRVRVGGLFETGMYDIDNTLILMPLKDIEETLGLGPIGIEVKINDVYKADHIRQEILKMLGPGFFARTWIEMNRNLFSALKLEKIAMFIILCLIIFVASFNIISSLIMTVMEKRKDIAILKAMGAKSRSIMKIFMVEGVTIGISGALIGSILGYGICELIERYKIIKLPTDIYYISTLPVKISPFDVIIIAGITIVISILSTLYPSYKASRIDPVEALRYE